MQWQIFLKSLHILYFYLSFQWFYSFLKFSIKYNFHPAYWNEYFKIPLRKTLFKKLVSTSASFINKELLLASIPTVLKHTSVFSKTHEPHYFRGPKEVHHTMGDKVNFNLHREWGWGCSLRHQIITIQNRLTRVWISAGHK